MSPVHQPIANQAGAIEAGATPTEAGRAMRLFRNEEFVRCLSQAVATVLAREHAGSPLRARRTTNAVLRAFFLLARNRARRVRGMTRKEFLAYLQRTRAELVEQRERTQNELEALRADVRAARASLASWRPDGELERVADAALEADLVAHFPGLPRAALAAVVTGERERRRQLFGKALAEPLERIDLLERRLTKLRVSLRTMEKALAELARRANEDHGIASIYRAVQGLDAAAEDREQRLALLTTIFEENLTLQRRRAA
jgi:Mg2+ and Co2+ transporter CorA